MSAGSTTFTLRRVAALSLVSLWLAGCSGNNNQAPISSVGGGNGSATSGGSGGGMLITPPQPMSGGTAQSAPQVQQAPQIQPVPSAQPVAPSPALQHDPVQVQNGRIVYNRKYDNIPKGSYTGGSTYTVQHGDTLFYIAWITGNDFRDLAQRNSIPEPYSLTVGQTLQLGANQNTAQAAAPVTTPVTPAPAPAQKSSTTVASQPVITYSEDSGEQSANKMLPNNKSAGTTVTAPVTAPTVSSTVSTTSSSSGGDAAVSAWRWPTEGKVIENFSSSEGGNKGIDIAGSKGQSIVATANGRVVYAGNALRGYGNLIIIKHNDDYLSAYAHNDTMLVREQQEVKAGQKIATMGSTGTSSTRLHFEIRYKGKSVNPLQYLPQR
ncbi:murein hydrolase activator NlpD [Entomohabitans teleogrylli]|uniref:murein hydrolase activator NlpD n=1 Tax=Entomohabitans teleogrylli TaxID=1384589 RepID=UPI00073D672C|nr:murein hydrolase activator NlpD [Entomohabitans teleogrylli]